MCRNSDRKPNWDYRDGRRQNKTGFRPTRLRRRPDRSAHPVRDGARNFYRTCAASFHKKILHRAQVQYTIKYSLMVSVIFFSCLATVRKKDVENKGVLSDRRLLYHRLRLWDNQNGNFCEKNCRDGCNQKQLIL